MIHIFLEIAPSSPYLAFISATIISFGPLFQFTLCCSPIAFSRTLALKIPVHKFIMTTFWYQYTGVQSVTFAVLIGPMESNFTYIYRHQSTMLSIATNLFIWRNQFKFVDKPRILHKKSFSPYLVRILHTEKKIGNFKTNWLEHLLWSMYKFEWDIFRIWIISSKKLPIQIYLILVHIFFPCTLQITFILTHLQSLYFLNLLGWDCAFPPSEQKLEVHWVTVVTISLRGILLWWGMGCDIPLPQNRQLRCAPEQTFIHGLLFKGILPRNYISLNRKTNVFGI